MNVVVQGRVWIPRLAGMFTKKSGGDLTTELVGLVNRLLTEITDVRQQFGLLAEKNAALRATVTTLEERVSELESLPPPAQ